MREVKQLVIEPNSTIEFKPGSYQSITEMIFFNGYQKSKSLWKANSRIKQLKLYIDESLITLLNLWDVDSPQFFVLPKEITPNDKKVKIRVEITDVFKGDKYSDTAISEIIFW